MPSRKTTIKARNAGKRGQAKTNLQDPIYHDGEAARAHLESVLWADGPECPRCHAIGARVTKLQGASTRPGVYNCKDCRKPFSVTVGTVMERSKIPLHKWVLASHFMMSSKKGMSALQLQRLLGTNYESAWFLCHRLREASTRSTITAMGGEGKFVEADETYIGGKAANKHAYKRLPADLAYEAKKAVVTLVERDGEARSFHIANVTSKTLRTVIVTNASRKSHLMTDGHSAYPKIGAEFAAHGAVNHHLGEYVRDGVIHSNTAESFFAILKRGVYGTFHSISEAHLHRYLAEFDFRYSNRKLADVERAELLLKGTKGKRLMYRESSQAAHA
jgi:transposase-like protein